MKSKPNRYLQSVCTGVGESDHLRATAVLLNRYRSSADNLQTIAVRLGIQTIKEEPLPFDGGVFEVEGQSLIKINSLSPPARRRFTLAHEIAHLVLESYLPFKSMKRRSNCSANPALEDACDSLAAELLMPLDEVVPFIQSLGFQSPEKLQLLARRYAVSLHSAARRVHEDLHLWKRPIGLWNYDSAADELWFVGRRPWNTKHPSFAAFDLAKASPGPVCTQELYSDGVLTRPVSLKMLHLGRNRVLGMVAVAR
jgi:hypothetical protein